MRFFTVSFFAAVLSLTFGANPAAACPVGAETLVSCTLKKGRKALQTCLQGHEVSYAFGAKGATPDLQLSRHVSEVDLQPWPGIGRSIWEEFTVENQGVLYLVHYGFERRGEEVQSPLYGGVTVVQNGKTLAQLDCDVGSVTSAGYPLPLFAAKEAVGQTYAHESQSWH